MGIQCSLWGMNWILLVLFKWIQVSNLDRRTLVRELHMVFKIPYVYDYITKYARNR
jgi:hypothetical protein